MSQLTIRRPLGELDLGIPTGLRRDYVVVPEWHLRALKHEKEYFPRTP
jgi:hypothetical protein